MTPELEIILAEGAGMEPGYSSDKVSSFTIVTDIILMIILIDVDITFSGCKLLKVDKVIIIIQSQR